MDIQTHNYYQNNAPATVARQRAVSGGISVFFQRAFRGCARILDVGCGAGRDVQALRKLGHQTEGVDGSSEIIQTTIAVDPSLADILRVDTLPELSTCADDSYDGVLCAAVLQHLPCQPLSKIKTSSMRNSTDTDCPEFPTAWVDAAFAFRRILRTGGCLLISIPLPDPTIDPETHRDGLGRLFTPIPPEKLQLLLERTGFVSKWREDSADAMGREHRSWCTMLFERASSSKDNLET